MALEFAFYLFSEFLSSLSNPLQPRPHAVVLWHPGVHGFRAPSPAVAYAVLSLLMALVLALTK